MCYKARNKVKLRLLECTYLSIVKSGFGTQSTIHVFDNNVNRSLKQSQSRKPTVERDLFSQICEVEDKSVVGLWKPSVALGVGSDEFPGVSWVDQVVAKDDADTV